LDTFFDRFRSPPVPPGLFILIVFRSSVGLPPIALVTNCTLFSDFLCLSLSLSLLSLMSKLFLLLLFLLLANFLRPLLLLYSSASLFSTPSSLTLTLTLRLTSSTSVGLCFFLDLFLFKFLFFLSFSPWSESSSESSWNFKSLSSFYCFSYCMSVGNHLSQALKQILSANLLQSLINLLRMSTKYCSLLLECSIVLAFFNTSSASLYYWMLNWTVS